MDKQEKIIKMFDEIAPSYDITNRFISLGIDKSWRKKSIKIALSNFKNSSINIADIATGTGDMIDNFIKLMPNFNVSVNQIYGIDPSAKMLDIAKSKFPSVKFLQASATDLPLDDNSIDILSISYGIRNVVDINKALDEFYRVLNNNGILLILEFTKDTQNSMIFKAKNFYMNKILPLIGATLSKNRPAYEYLPNSIEHFFSSDEFEQLLKEHNFKIIKSKNFSFNVSSMFIAQKI